MTSKELDKLEGKTHKLNMLFDWKSKVGAAIERVNNIGKYTANMVDVDIKLTANDPDGAFEFEYSIPFEDPDIKKQIIGAIKSCLQEAYNDVCSNIEKEA